MIVVGTTIAAFAMEDEDIWKSWLINADEQKLRYASQGHELRHFVAIQIDARGVEPFIPLIQEIQRLQGEYWTYSLDDGREKVTMTNRWRHITFGQNLVTEYCQSHPDCTHLLFMAADTAAPPDIIDRMLEMDHPLVAPFIPTYCLRGPRAEGFPDEWEVEDAVASAACIFIARSVFTKIRWRWDLDAGMSDDPCYHYDALTYLMTPTYVRHDVEARHYPESIGDYESRGFNTEVVR